MKIHNCKHGLMRKHFLFVHLFLCINLVLHAQRIDKEHLSVGMRSFSGNIMAHDGEVKSFLRNGYHGLYALTLGYRTLPKDSSLFASDYNYPVFGLGVSMANFSDVVLTEGSCLGDIYSVYGFMDRALFRCNRWRMDYNLEAGLAYATYPYNPLTNPANEFVSSPLMVYVGFGVGMKYMITNQIEIGVNADLKHYSNGRLGMPNKGINIACIGANVRYYFEPLPENFSKMPETEFQRQWYYHVTAGMGWQTSLEEWNISAEQPDPGLKQSVYKKYPKYSISTDAMYRLSRRYGTGVGLDFFYTPHIDKLREWDKALTTQRDVNDVKYNPLSVGIVLNQEVYYRNLAVFAGFGYYAFRRLGIQEDEGRFYQRAGFRLYFPRLNNMFVGYGIKAHNFSMAEYLELSVGMKF